jgi:hypothetical protein
MKIRRFLAQFGIIWGATIIGPQLYGFARPGWGFGVFIAKEPKKT